jgi:glutaredoxin
MSEVRGRIEGVLDSHRVVLYGLSTCGWCADAQEFLTKQGVAFDFVYVDLLDRDAMNSTVDVLKRWNPGMVFPLVVVDDATAVVGFQPEKITEALGL